ncbi:hypothetical protein [Falsibacillus albus]|uniref:Uncharacterized protein n=1 Tax=Falsibacillus albus TaxID=2478915 RepID=A0A3L7JUF4_9BACI|nr:hypothetical protein [Falsibacillus albus]RLQ93241.1 hypothetical protein D9X91_18615 [Falsibacillus albus]
MIVRGELNDDHFQVPSPDLAKILYRIREDRLKEIEEIKHKINQYEKKKRAEEAFYQSLSPVRKFFASRPPSHHQAVEYIVHVKERIKLIDVLKKQCRELDDVLELIEADPGHKEVVLSTALLEGVNRYRKWGDLS